MLDDATSVPVVASVCALFVATDATQPFRAKLTEISAMNPSRCRHNCKNRALGRLAACTKVTMFDYLCWDSISTDLGTMNTYERYLCGAWVVEVIQLSYYLVSNFRKA